MASLDAFELVEDIGCLESASQVVERIVTFAGKPTEAEILARCSMVFEYILHSAISSANLNPADFSVAVESEEE